MKRESIQPMPLSRSDKTLTTESPSCGLHDGKMVAHDAGSIIEAGLDIFTNEAGIFLEHIFNGITSGEIFQNGLHRDPRAPNDRSAITDIWIDRNALWHETQDTINGLGIQGPRTRVAIRGRISKFEQSATEWRQTVAHGGSRGTRYPKEKSRGAAKERVER